MQRQEVASQNATRSTRLSSSGFSAFSRFQIERSERPVVALRIKSRTDALPSSVCDHLKFPGQKSPTKFWERLKKAHPEVITLCENLKFPGPGQRLAPVAITAGQGFPEIRPAKSEKLTLETWRFSN